MFNMALVLLIFAVTYIIIITEWINKMTIALLGGFLIILCGIMTQDVAMSYIDWNVIFLLIGMMIIMGVLRETGVFQYIAIKTAKLAKGSPLRIMLLMFLVTATISAFLDNVTTVMIIVPVTILITNELNVSPIPFVISAAVASNIGGTATLIGDPPNILIGSATKLSFIDFFFHLTPVIVVIMAASLLFIYFKFKGKMVVTNERKARLLEFDDSQLITNKSLLRRAGVVMGLLLVGFFVQEFIGLSSATIAMTAALVMLIMSNRKEVEQILTKDVDWVSLFFFIGLFMIVGGLKETGVLGISAKFILRITHSNLQVTSLAIIWFSGILSAVIDNVPFVATMIPLIKDMQSSFGNVSIDPLWWSLALGSCLGGNATLIGASANIISAGIAKKSGYPISFGTFFKASVIITFISLVISTIYIYLRYFLLA
jgi:Na+/H+ antiporter NhaD/arsenite permease-like protein